MMMVAVAMVALSVSIVHGQFIDFDNPLAVVPPIMRPIGAGASSCKVELFSNVTFDAYNKVVTSVYDASACAETKWSMAVVDLTFTCGKGVQFDRSGGVWIDGLEILRTTTSEPHPYRDISWKIEKDVTMLMDRLNTAAKKQAHVLVPNLVNSYYNGIISLTASVTFYETQSAPKKDLAKRLFSIPLSKDASSHTVFDEMGVNNVSYSVTLPHRNARRANLYLLTSPHQTEEFFYGNTPKQNGGPYRQLDVYIDGVVCGRVVPFETVYTGGLSPQLWHPFVATETYDVTPYQIDITPFLAWLNDGKNHTISVNAVGAIAGVWYSDLILVYERDQHDQILTGQVGEHTSEPPRVIVKPTGNNSWITTASSTYSVFGTLCGSKGCEKTSVETALNAKIHTSETDSGLQKVKAIFQSHDTVLNSDGAWESAHVYPIEFSLLDSSTQDRLIITASVVLERKRMESFTPSSNSSTQSPWNLQWTNTISAAAVYNRTQATPREYGTNYQASTATMDVYDGKDGACYSLTRSSLMGKIRSAPPIPPVDKCLLPPGAWFCGIEVCGIDFL